MKNLLAKKDFGQNFLVDEMMIERMVRKSMFSSEDIVLEIGPGKGAVTRHIAQMVKEMTLVEADKDFVKALQEEFKDEHVHVIKGSILDYQLSKKVKVFGNIPYNISTPVIEWILAHRENITEVFLTVQLEFAQRLLAKKGTKQRCPLSCLIEVFTETEILFRVPSFVFRPMPKVTSSFLRMKILQEPKFDIKRMDIFINILRQAFLQRRKTMQNALKSFMDVRAIAQSLSLKRPEDVSIEEFVMLANAILHKG